MKKEDTVKLISAEGFEFVVDKEAAMVSQTIHNMLTSPGSLLYFIILYYPLFSAIRVPSFKIIIIISLIGSFAERQHGEVTFPEISTTILEKICQYFYWHLQFARFFFLPLRCSHIAIYDIIFRFTLTAIYFCN